MKKIILIISLFIATVGFSQQIGDGHSPIITDFNLPLKSGVYTGKYATGVSPDENYWQHLFVIRHTDPNNNFQLQMTSSYTVNDRLFFRKIGGDPSNSAWLELATRGSNTFNGSQTISGNLGIGNVNPLAKLDVSGDVILRNYENIDGKGNKIIFTAYGHDLQGPQIRSYLSFASGNDSRMGLVLSSYTQGYNDELFLMGGNVGIGKMHPTNKLDVNGTVHSKEVKVDMTGWSDFVFKKEYNLPTLAEVENHIKAKGHLENIPSEEEVLKNGINLGEMNAKLLQKIEELTLYLIEMKKENIEMKNRLIKLEKK